MNKLTLANSEIRLDLVIKSEDGLIANTKPLVKLLEEVNREKDEVLKEIGVESINKLSSKVSTFRANFSKYRIRELRKITDIPKEFIAIENSLKKISRELKDVANERTAKEREEKAVIADATMRRVLISLMEESEYGSLVDIRVFDANLALMRTKAYAQPYKSGSPKQALVKRIKELWDTEYREVEEKEKLKALKKAEALHFEQVQREIRGSHDELLSIKDYYLDLLSRVTTLYPHSIEEFTRTIESKLQIIEASLESKRLKEEKEKEKEKEKEEFRIRNNEIRRKFILLKKEEYSSINELELVIVQLRGLHKRTTDESLWEEIHSHEISIMKKIENIRSEKRRLRAVKLEKEKQYREAERLKRETETINEAERLKEEIRLDEEARLNEEAKREERIRFDEEALVAEQIRAERESKETHDYTLVMSKEQKEMLEKFLHDAGIEVI